MKYITLILSIVFFIVGCAKTAAVDEVVATVNSEKITAGMLDERINELPEYYQSAAVQHKKEILDDLIIEKLLFNEAKKKKIYNDEEVKSLIEKAKRKILIAKLLESETSPKKSVSDEDIESYYNQYKEQFLVPERVRASHILLSTEEEAKKVSDALATGADFDEMAKLHSKDLTKDRGGDLGYFQKGQMIPEFENVCFNLQPGQTSGIVQTRFGYHIIKVIDKRPAEYKQLSEVKENIRAKLIEQSKQQQFDDFVQLLKNKARIQVKEDVLKKESTKETPEESTSAKQPLQ